MFSKSLFLSIFIIFLTFENTGNLQHHKELLVQELIKLAKPIRDKYLLASCLGFTVESYELVYGCCQILKVGPGLVDRNQN